jgi:hypothetical protein
MRALPPRRLALFVSRMAFLNLSRIRKDALTIRARTPSSSFISRWIGIRARISANSKIGSISFSIVLICSKGKVLVLLLEII